MLILSFCLLYYIVYCKENRLKINFTLVYGKMFYRMDFRFSGNNGNITGRCTWYVRYIYTLQANAIDGAEHNASHCCHLRIGWRIPVCKALSYWIYTVFTSSVFSNYVGTCRYVLYFHSRCGRVGLYFLTLQTRTTPFPGLKMESSISATWKIYQLMVYGWYVYFWAKYGSI